MECRVSLKVQHAHFDKIKNNIEAYSEEQGKHFHQEVMDFAHRYQYQYNENVIGRLSLRFNPE